MTRIVIKSAFKIYEDVRIKNKHNQEDFIFDSVCRIIVEEIEHFYFVRSVN